MKRTVLLYTAMVLVLASTSVFAAKLKIPPPAAEFFENAWNAAASTQNYQYVCTVSSRDIKAETDSLTPDQKKVIEIVQAALKKYKNKTTTIFSGNTHQVFSQEDKVNTLAILDAISAGTLTADQGADAVKSPAKKTVSLVLADIYMYYKGQGGWKMFSDADTVAQIYDGIAAQPSITTPLEKSSFVFKTYAKAGKAQAAVYQGNLTSWETSSLLTPFIGETIAAQQSPASVKLSVDNATGQFKKYDVSSRVTVGGLAFIVKEGCTFDFTHTDVKVPTGASEITKDEGLQEFSQLAQ